MQNRDEFDGPDIRGAVGSIFNALDRQKGRMEPRKPVWATAIVLSLMTFLGTVLWFSYPREAAKGADPVVPIIRADAGSYKIVPRDPGGMDIPHRDSTVFDTLRAGRETEGGMRRVESLLPESETPLPREQLFAGLKTEVKVEGRTVAKYEDKPDSVTVAKVEETVSKPIPSKSEAAEANAVPEPVKVAVAAPVPTPAPAPKPDRQAAETASKTEPAAGVETFEGSYFVQLASLKSEEAGETAWAGMLKELHMLRPYKHRIQRADLGAKGVYYRVQAGPMKEAQAKQVCEAIKAQRPGGCLVTRD